VKSEDKAFAGSLHQYDTKMNQVRGALIVLLLPVVALLLPSGAFAVDRSKFRTCQQTSFCRRHRADHSARLYKYKVEKDSIHFHLPNSDEHKAAEAQKNKDQQQKGLWSSLSKRILGDDSDSPLDPYVQGTTPTLTGILSNTATETSTKKKEQLKFALHAMEDGLVRVRVTELYGLEGSAHEKARVTYDDLVLEHANFAAAAHALYIPPGDDKLKKAYGDLVQDNLDNFCGLEYGDKEGQHSMALLVRLDSFAMYLFREGENTPVMVFGTQNRMHFEIRRTKDGASEGEEEKDEENANDGAEKNDGEEEKYEKEIVGYWEDGLAIYADGTREEKKVVEEDEHRKLTETELDTRDMWEEKFSSHVDSKPFGPMSVGMDISFPKSEHLFGLPEHASSAVLKPTQGPDSHYTEPYRLYNLDVFEYELDETMALYGNVPLVVSHSAEMGTAGMFWFNPSETFVDVEQGDGDVSTHFLSESGVVDIFMIPGPSPADVYRQYAHLTGTLSLPPAFSLGYHQCRWNYKDEKDVYQVHENFEELDYPYDVLWLDIEHTDGKRYFTWDKNLFPNPEEMQKKLWSQGRRMVTIIDPHIKRDDGYHIHKEATSKGLYIKDKDGKKDFDGWCWPGSSSYLDFTQEKVRNWWAEQFSFNKYKGSTESLFTWNDMNEMSVFNGPEVTMQKDTLNLDGEEHREWHNLYGMMFHRATGEGQVKRIDGDDIRPFVLSRAFFAGSQKYGAIWTGDNLAEWSHLEVASPMLLSLNVGALSFVGADVGGFFGNPDAELMTRWMQAGAYQPFFRGHAHHDAKRREPWMFGDETMRRLRKAAMARYALLPHWYTVFHEASVTGMPVMRTMWMEYPQTAQLFSTDDQYMIGSDLLVKPVTGPGVTETTVAFPTKDTWYDVETLAVVSQAGKEETGVNEITVASDIDKIPVYQRGGSVVSRKLRLRRSSQMMKTDPYTLYIALDKESKAAGVLYMDDEETFGHEKRNEYAEASFSADLGSKSKTIESTVSVGSGWTSKVDELKPQRMVERIVVIGLTKAPKSIEVDGTEIVFEYISDTKVLTLRKPRVSALGEWKIKLQ